MNGVSSDTVGIGYNYTDCEKPWKTEGIHSHALTEIEVNLDATSNSFQSLYKQMEIRAVNFEICS